MMTSICSKNNIAMSHYDKILGWTLLLAAAMALSVVQMVQCGSIAMAEEQPVEQECENGVCVPDDTAERWHTILSHVQCMDDALDEFEETGESDDLSLTFEPYRIIVTEDGQVFEKESMATTLIWCDYELDFDTRPDVQVSMQKDAPDADPFWGFRLRVRLGAYVWGRALTSLDFDNLTHPAVLVEPFYVGYAHLAAYGSLHSFGVVTGVDLTENFNLYGGVGATWQEAEVGPVVGVSFSFN